MVKGSHEQYHIIMNEGAKTSGWHLQFWVFWVYDSTFPVFACISTTLMTVACLWQSIFSGMF